LFGCPRDNKADLAQLADPVTHVRAAAPPFLIVHGDRDPPISSAWHALRLHDALRAAGNDSTLWVYGGYGHDLGARWDECRQLLLRFF
jgi:dipeptidyl aminopeptidase/acylaminoacyl peptidase